MPAELFHLLYKYFVWNTTEIFHSLNTIPETDQWNNAAIVYTNEEGFAVKERFFDLFESPKSSNSSYDDQYGKKSFDISTNYIHILWKLSFWTYLLHSIKRRMTDN